MEEDFTSILEVGKRRVARLGYTIWDIVRFPKACHHDKIGSSFRFSYDLHTTLFGTPNKELLSRFNPRGKISLSFDPEWLEIVRECFTNFELMDKSAKGQEMNTFLGMELNRETFNAKSTYEAQVLGEEISHKLNFKQRILFSNSEGGGVGIIRNGEIVGVAFAPHVLSNEDFSFAIIRGVWVSKDNRNKGYGYDVSAKMCEELFAKGIETVTLWVEETNIPAVKVYEKMGFVTVDRVFGTDCIKKIK